MPTYTVDWTSHHTADWEKHLSHLKDKQAIGLEIGVFEGRSTAWFCQNVLTHEKSRLICVDIFTVKERYAAFLKNLMENDLLHKVEVRRQPSSQMALPPNYLDFGYIDGNHEASAVMTDSVLVWRSLKQGGVMIWDDVLWPGPNRKVPYLTPQPAIESFLHLYGSQLELLAKSHHAIIRKK